MPVIPHPPQPLGWAHRSPAPLRKAEAAWRLSDQTGVKAVSDELGTRVAIAERDGHASRRTESETTSGLIVLARLRRCFASPLGPRRAPNSR